MRSAVLVGLVVLGACKQQTTEQIVTVALPTGPAVSISPPPANAAKPADAVPNTVPVKAETMPDRFQALGTEPFWSFDIEGERLSYTNPEQPTPVVIKAHLTAMGKHGNGGLLYEGLMDGKPVSLMIREGECSDGMSDTVYAYKAEFKWGDQTQQGCARQK